MLDVSFIIAWILFLSIHIVVNLYLFFLKSKVHIRYFFTALLITTLLPSIMLHWHYVIIGLASIVFLILEKKILKKIILLNNVTASFGVFFILSGGFEPVKLLLFCIMTDYAVEYTTIVAHKWIMPRRKDHD